nr:MATH domain and coiled-coil domain-containing protein At2g01790-like [Ipomoea batatas]
MKTEWGFDQLLPLSIFNDPSNGYLVDDTCAFGAEIVVVSNATKGECLSLVKDPVNKKYTWRISNFASKQREQHVIYSDEFTIEGSTWKLQVFPKGDSSAKDKNLSLFLESVDSSNLTVNNGRRLYAKYKLRICNQLKPGEDQEKEATCVFGGSPAVTRWGYYYFLLLNQLESVAKGFLLNDTLIVEMEETDKKSSKQTFGNMDSTAGVERLKRDIPPAHFIFMIRSFSLLDETGNEKHESGVFQACDKKMGKKKQADGDGDGDGHISLYLEIVDTNNYPRGWEVHVKFSLFVYDYVQDKYLTVQVDDTCAFGAEILVISDAATKRRECLSMVKDPTSKTFTWTINNFASKKNQELVISDEFNVEGSKWILSLFPSGAGSVKGKHLSLFLHLADLSNLKDHARKLFARYRLRICNQLKSSENHEKKDYLGVGTSARIALGYSSFMNLDELDSATKGFLVNDTLIVEVELMVLSKFSDF